MSGAQDTSRPTPAGNAARCRTPAAGRPALLVAVLALGFLVPAVGATHVADAEEVMFPPGEGPAVVGRFEFDQTAVRPPADLEGFLVLESRSQGGTVNGSILAGGDSALVVERTGLDGTEAPTAQQGQENVAARVDVLLEPYETVRIPFTVPVRGFGHVSASFAVDRDASYVPVRQAQVFGVVPVEVSLDDPEPGARLVSVPGRPAEMTLTLTALPGSNLTDLLLSGYRAWQPSERVEVGDLRPGEQFTATLTKAAEDEGPLRSRSVHRAGIIPNLQGMVDGESFSHPLYRSEGERLEPIHPAVYIAPESTLFLLAPQDARLGVPTTLDVVVLNAGTEPVRARGRVELSMPGVPSLDVDFHVDERVGPGMVETLRLDWTPAAAGPWQATVRHDLGPREPHSEPVHVAGPIAGLDLQARGLSLERGTPTSVPVVLTASEDVDLHGLSLTSRRAPLEGVISIDDLFSVRRVPGTSLERDEPVTLELDFTPRATGTYRLYAVVETPDGLSVHDVGALTVGGSTAGWPLAWSPTLVVGSLVGAHVAWRRWWIHR